MRGIICYDFSEDKERTKFAKILSKYGFRMQYSVFEFNLDKQTWKKMVEELKSKKFLDGKHSVVIIPLPQAAYQKITKIGDMFLSFEHSMLMYSADGVVGTKILQGNETKESFEVESFYQEF